jgi:rhamnogalacturonyl hydrolase YesR
MDRRSFLFAAAFASAQGAISQPVQSTAEEDSNSPDKLQSRSLTGSGSRIAKAAAAAMAMQRRDWEQGILAQAMLEADDREKVILLTKAAMVQRTQDGRMGVVVSGSPTDPAMGGAAYAQAAEWTGDPLMRQAVAGLLDWIRNKAPRNPEGILYHTFGAPEIWSDGFNGAPPFLAAMGFHDEALTQIEGFRQRLWDPEKKLLAHIWDDGKRQFTDASYWGGGNGWAAAGLARVIRSLPSERRQDRERLAGFAREIVDGCLQYQRADGLFHNVVDRPATFVETNLAQMLAFAVYEGVAGAWLPQSYKAHADRMREAARQKMDAYGYVQGACGAPNFDRPGTSTEAQAFCIMMEAAGSKTESRHPGEG